MAHYDCPECGTQCGYYDRTPTVCGEKRTVYAAKTINDARQDLGLAPIVTNTPGLVMVPLTTQNNTARQKNRFYEIHVGYEYHICDSADGCRPDGHRTPVVRVDDNLPYYMIDTILKAMNEAKPS